MTHFQYFVLILILLPLVFAIGLSFMPLREFNSPPCDWSKQPDSGTVRVRAVGFGGAPGTLILRNGTKESWLKHNPVLFPYEPAFETDTGKVKLGDGKTAYKDLKYCNNLKKFLNITREKE